MGDNMKKCIIYYNMLKKIFIPIIICICFCCIFILSKEDSEEKSLVYKLGNSEYLSYISDSVEEILGTNKSFYLYQIDYSSVASPYIRIYIYPIEKYSYKEYNVLAKKLTHEIWSKISEKKYKTSGPFSNNSNIVGLEFYTKNKRGTGYEHLPVGYYQFNILEIGKQGYEENVYGKIYEYNFND